MEAETAPMGDMGAGFTVDAPAAVLPGREASFESLIADARNAAAQEGPLRVFAAAEYRGVIYEFSTDDSGTRLWWRDAAEGVVPILSPGTVSELWTDIGY